MYKYDVVMKPGFATDVLVHCHVYHSVEAWFTQACQLDSKGPQAAAAATTTVSAPQCGRG